MMDPETLCGCIRETAEAHGYDMVSASVEEFPHMKIKWLRTETLIHLSASDYLLALDPETVRLLIDLLLRRIRGLDAEVSYTPEISRALSSESFAETNQPLFIERNGLSRTPKSWRDYQKLAESQGAVLPRGMKVFLAPKGYSGDPVVPTMRVAVMPREISASDPGARLRRIEESAVRIGRGHGGRSEDAPDHYVTLD